MTTVKFLCLSVHLVSDPHLPPAPPPPNNTILCSGGSRIFLRWGRQPSGGANVRFCQIFLKNCMKLKEFGPREREAGSKILLCRSATALSTTNTENKNMRIKKSLLWFTKYSAFSDIIRMKASVRYDDSHARTLARTHCTTCGYFHM